ncbi:MAG: peptide chain release factor N(5)-glutamine methyltransferase, partial [Oscillospiraceae bacterium]|nr:peptide chain release factor N(5)-glutamine methyltransferase [Oscillospiraceae bacterium]
IPYSGFDLIVCNPPYLTGEDMRNLQREVRHEPESALFGGEDGLDFYRKLIPIYAPRLHNGGMLALEIGKGQEEAVSELFRKSGLNPQTKPDANGIIRVVYATRE